jgi:ferredoxin--NADP+ reductase
VISVPELRQFYDQVVLAYGCADDRKLGIEGESARGVHSAANFVAWYNGHPNAEQTSIELSGRRAVVLGGGNVALDIARVLVRDPNELAATDVPEGALAKFRQSRIDTVVIALRRGPAEAAFTERELRGLRDVPGVCVSVDRSIELDFSPPEHADGETRAKLELLASLDAAANTRKDERQVVVSFLQAPAHFVVEDDQLLAVRLEQTELVLDHEGRQRARGTGRFSEIETELAISAVGYRGRELRGVPFDPSRGVIPNHAGRVVDALGSPLVGLYVAGWIGRGPSGVIGTNKDDAHHTVQALLEDLALGRSFRPGRESGNVLSLLRERGAVVLDKADYQKLDELERARGTELGKVREKFTSLKVALAALRAARSAPNEPTRGSPS